jgi:hypothetical protein
MVLRLPQPMLARFGLTLAVAAGRSSQARWVQVPRLHPRRLRWPVRAAACEDDTTADTFDAAGLKSRYDAGLKLNEAFGSTANYCLFSTVGNKTAKVLGPGGTVIQHTVACVSSTS